MRLRVDSCCHGACRNPRSLVPVGVFAGCEVACARGQPSPVSAFVSVAGGLESSELSRSRPSRKKPVRKSARTRGTRGAHPGPSESLRFSARRSERFAHQPIIGSYSHMVSLSKPMITDVISSPATWWTISFATPLRWARRPPLHSVFPSAFCRRKWRVPKGSPRQSASMSVVGGLETDDRRTSPLVSARDACRGRGLGAAPLCPSRRSQLSCRCSRSRDPRNSEGPSLPGETRPEVCQDPGGGAARLPVLQEFLRFLPGRVTP
jgi:hypothetical protein